MSKNNTMVSVVIPTYNRKETIKRSIDSVLGQTYQNIEIIIVDDCSTDNTYEYIAELYGEVDNLIYIRNDNNIGPSASRNVGVLAANGDYIAFQDSDDEWLPDKIEKQMDVMLRHITDVGVVYSRFMWKWQDGTEGEWPPANWADERKQGNVFPSLLINPLVGMITLLIRKDAYFEVGGLNEELEALEDYEFTIRVSEMYQFALIDEVLAIAYESDESVGKRNDSKIITQCYIMDKYKGDLAKYQLKKIKFQAVLNEAQNYGNVNLYLNTLIKNCQDLDYIFYVKDYLKGILPDKEEIATSNISGVTRCTGCMSCVCTCPYDAIEQKHNEEGFLRPVVNQEKCKQCKACIKSCPVCTECASYNLPEESYAVIADDKLRRESSSGGVFPYIAWNFISNGGYVAGAAFDSNYHVKHIIVNKCEDLLQIQSSKYVQSNMGKTYCEVKALLENNERVLFSGCACQVAGLKTYLKKEYDNLFLMDVVCHGVPSSGIFMEYIKNVTEGRIEDIQEISFRKKEKMGWNPGFYLKTKDGKELLEAASNPYMMSFLKNWSLQECCYECKFKGKQYSDLTLGDFWGINELADFDDGLGTSVVIPNTSKGLQILNQISPYVKKIASVPTKYAIKYNPCINQSVNKTVGRRYFFEEITQNQLGETVHNVMKRLHHDIGLVLMWSQNYGNALTNYALYKAIEKVGKHVMVLDNFCTLKPENQFKEFAKKHYECSSDFFQDNDIGLLNICCDTFVVGSDQVWNFAYEQFYHYGYFFQLDFVGNDKKKISYASSFGSMDGALEENIGKQLYQRFYAISVREASGIDICRSKYQMDAVNVVDPVFLLNQKEYEELAETSNLQEDTPYILAYLLNPTSQKRQLCVELQKRLGIKVINIIDAGMANRLRNMAILEYDGIKADLKVEDFVYYIQHSTYIVTDSYHGTCFSIIFNKPFVTIKNRETDRFNTFNKFAELKKHIIEEHELPNYKQLLEKINYKQVNEQLRRECERSQMWLEKHL